MYYRLAMHQRRDPLYGEGSWQWTSTVLSSLQSLLQVLRLYSALPQAHLRVFSSHTPEGLQEQLRQENGTGGSASPEERMDSMKIISRQRLVRLLVGCCLSAVCLTACNSPHSAVPSSTTPTVKSTGSPGKAESTPATSPTAGSGNPSNTTMVMPPTQTTCPPAGTARAAVVRPLARGSDPVIVYRKGSLGETFVRYDVVTQLKTTILSLHGAEPVSQVQLSSDGQWLLFVAPEGAGQDFSNAIQMVRLDGQGLQTLYCSSASGGFSIEGTQWGLDDKTVIFSQGDISGGPASYTLQVMDMATGSVQQELVKPASMLGFFAVTWLDPTHAYLVQSDRSGYPQALFSLDTTRGSQQSVTQLIPILGPAPAGTSWSFDTSIDGSTIYTAHCHHPDLGTFEGPSTISVQPATGGQPSTIDSDQTHAITEVRIMTRSLLAYVVANQNSGDTAENGLWMMKTDGTGSTRLTSSLTTVLNPGSQYTWANFSRDGSRYAVLINDGQQRALIFGSLTGNGSQTTLESEAGALSPGEDYEMVGWTTL